MFDREYFNLGHLDRLSYGTTVIHRLDPRAKVVGTLAFIITVISFPKYEITGLLPFFLFPVLVFSLSDIPVNFILKKVLLVSFFALFIGMFNPVLDRRVLVSLYGLSISAGWVSFLSIMLKFLLTITSALLLIATTSFPAVCHALQKLGMPEAFISQMLFLYRYIFVLAEESMRVVRARDMRSFGRKGREMKHFILLIGQLFMKTMERAERVYSAMLARGFSGTIHSSKQYIFKTSDIAFLLLCLGLSIIFRLVNLPAMLGRLMIGYCQ